MLLFLNPCYSHAKLASSPLLASAALASSATLLLLFCLHCPLDWFNRQLPRYSLSRFLGPGESK